MPYKWQTDKTPIPRDKDKRVKLTEADREEIRQAYGKVSQRKLARMYGVSRRLIQFIGDPSKHKANLRRREERGGSMAYYDKEKNTKAIRTHRRHKQSVLKEGNKD